MILLNDTTAAELPDADAPVVGTLRWAAAVRVGWHVRVDGRWLLVERVHTEDAVHVVLWFVGGAMLTTGNQVWTRTPAEQIAYMSMLLPARDHYKPGLPIGTLYGGSASGPLVGLR